VYKRQHLDHMKKVDDISANDARHLPQQPNTPNPLARSNYRWSKSG